MLAYPGGDPYDSLYMGKAQPERVTFSGFRYLKGTDFISCNILLRQGNLSFPYVKRPEGANGCFSCLLKSQENVLVL